VSHGTADITGVIGATSTGKSLYTKQRLRRPFRGLTLVWSPLEERDHYAQVIGGDLVTTFRAMLERYRAGARRLVYRPELKRGLEPQFDAFCQLAWEFGNDGPSRVLVEELSRVTRASWAPPAWSNLSTAGSHHQGIELIATAQRPAMIDKNFLGGCTRARCYRLIYKADARAVADILQVPVLDLMNLPNLHWIERDIPGLKTSTGVQKIVSPALPVTVTVTGPSRR
jgi:hypothetical protein